ncbi:hypothetical protein HW132_31895 [Brasilonema sp. CT11]|nr:hypothetical protein [Brasilonema sp. CT11]
MSTNFLVRKFLKTGSSLIASVSIAIGVLSPIVLNSSKTLADTSAIGTPVEVNSAIQDLANKGISPNTIAFAPNGGWVIIHGGYGYISSNLRQDLLETLYKLYKQKQPIVDIAFTPTGEWIVTYGIWDEGIATSANLPAEVVTAISDVRKKNKYIYKVAFAPNGSFVFVYDRNSYSVSPNISPEIVAYLEAIKKKNAAFTDIAFNSGGSFIVISGGSGYYTTSGIQPSLTDKINEINRNSVNNPSTAYKYFTGVRMTPNNGWVLLYQKP